MIKHWQTNQEYHCFLTNAKTTFDSSERVRLQSELASAREKLRLLDTDAAMHFLEPFYSNTGRPASNQPQILRSFVLFFLLVSINLTSPSLTTWVSRLKSDRVLASLLGCSVNSLPPLGSYYDFMDRLWTRPDHSLYKRGKLLSPGWNRKNRPNPKASIRRLPKTVPPSRTPLFRESLTARISLSTLRHGSKSFFIRLPYCPLSNVASFPTAPLPYPATALLSMPIPTQMDISCLPLPIPFLSRNTLHSQDIILTRMPHGGGTATSIPFTLAILCSSSPTTTLCCMQISRCCSALPAPDDMIQSLSLLLSMSWKTYARSFHKEYVPRFRYGQPAHLPASQDPEYKRPD